jgi:Leucine-rich repeat (LRR) protein
MIGNSNERKRVEAKLLNLKEMTGDSVEIGYTFIPSEYFSRFEDALMEKTSITSLDVSEVRSDNVQNLEEWTKLIIRVVIAHRGIKRLIMDRCDLGDGGAVDIKQLLLAKTTLESLSIEGNGFTAIGASLLAEGLKKNGYLLELRVGTNFWGGFDPIANSLDVNQTLEQLHLTLVNLKDEGIIYLAQCLSKNTQLTTLNLGRNWATVRSMKPLRTLIVAHPRLVHLELLDMPLGDEAICVISSFLNEMDLHSLNLTCCHITDIGARALSKALVGNRSIKSLNLWDNPFGDIGKTF